MRRHSQLRHSWRLHLEVRKVQATMVEYSSMPSLSTKILRICSCSSSLRSEFILCEVLTTSPCSIFVMNQPRGRHRLQFRHPLMQMFSSLQPFEREISKSSTPYRSLTSISWLRSSARLGFRVRRCARLKIRFAIAC